MLKKFILFLAFVIISIIITVSYFVFTGGGKKSGKFLSSSMTYEQATSRLQDILKNIRWTENYVRRKAKIQLGQKKDLKKSLPDISRYKLVVNPPSRGNDVIVEIFTSSEKSGTGTDGIMVKIANDFNSENKALKNGKKAKIAIRKIASGLGYEYITSKKYIPQAFSPSNHLWIQMVSAYGIKVTPISESLVGNIAGVVLKDSVAKRLKTEYGDLNVTNIIDAVVQGKLVMGYTNPFASSTGLNFLVSVLQTFAGGNPDTMLSPEVVSSFESFQQGVPFVALTTLQLRESVQNDGSLEAFVMEYQTFYNTPALKSGYAFIPFGIKHDNPLYAIGQVNDEQMEVLDLFARFTEKKKYKKLAKKYGFNPSLKYNSPFKIPPGNILVRAQQIWKEKKDAGRPISAVFLCDVSGSMRGMRLSKLKKALLSGSEFIAPSNSIGIVLFNHKVNVILPIKKFDLPQKAAFHAAVEDMYADGKTAMYDGIAVSLNLLIKEKQKNPNIKPILFVLTDGETNTGLTFNQIDEIIAGLNIPIYTIGYEANIGELKRLSSLVEAASLNADEGEIEYKIGSLLNAQM